MMRDPRDVIRSRHDSFEVDFFVDFSVWRFIQNTYERLKNHPRLITVSYEELVADPDQVQEKLLKQMPFLKKTARFSDFGNNSNVSELSKNALGGIRSVSTNSIGKWKSQKERIASQLATHPDLSEAVKKYGYEKDDQWLEELRDTPIIHKESHLYNSEKPLIETFKAGRKSLKRALRYFTRCYFNKQL